MINLKDFFEYNYWANDLYIQAFNEQSIDDAISIETFNHILMAIQVWLERIEGKSFGWKNAERTAFAEHNERLHEWAQQKVATADFSEIVSFSNHKGFEYNNELGMILLHTINHSTYHRGQLATRFRAIGKVPPTTDYIYWKRKMV